MWGSSKKPAKVDSAAEFSKAIDKAIAAARASGVPVRRIAGQLESRAEAMHQQWVMSAPVDHAW
jgi:hypothetical protein